MRRPLRSLWRDRKGLSALEFALVSPVLILIIVGAAQMGMMFLSHAGLRNLVAESARFVAIAPRPTDAAVKTRIRRGGFGLSSASIAEPVITYGTASGADFADIEVSYTMQLDFIFWRPPATVLTQRRRVFIYATA